jgi:hypothetical protein
LISERANKWATQGGAWSDGVKRCKKRLMGLLSVVASRWLRVGDTDGTLDVRLLSEKGAIVNLS